LEHDVLYIILSIIGLGVGLRGLVTKTFNLKIKIMLVQF